jgi:hypothetical protein
MEWRFPPSMICVVQGTGVKLVHMLLQPFVMKITVKICTVFVQQGTIAPKKLLILLNAVMGPT